MERAGGRRRGREREVRRRRRRGVSRPRAPYPAEVADVFEVHGEHGSQGGLEGLVLDGKFARDAMYHLREGVGGRGWAWVGMGGRGWA